METQSARPRQAVAIRPSGAVQRTVPLPGTAAPRPPHPRPRQGGRVQAAARPDFQLTARGGVLGLFAMCFFAMLLAEWTGWTALTGLAFVAGGGAAARYTKRGALLALAVCPPVVFLAACAAAETLTAPTTLTTLTGIIVTLATASPWLFAGTALIVGVAVCRGLPGEVADLMTDLRILIASLPGGRAGMVGAITPTGGDGWRNDPLFRHGG
jgi:uncharacterized protein DUF6542